MAFRTPAATNSTLAILRPSPDLAIVLNKNGGGINICSWKNRTTMFTPFQSPPVRTTDPHVAGTSFPFFLMQLFIGNAVFRPVFSLAKFLRIPRFVAQMLSGILLGPSGIGENLLVRGFIFPYRYALVLESFANLALVYNMFLVGLEMDLSLMKRVGSKALSIAITGILFSFAVAMFFYSEVVKTDGIFSKEGIKGVFWAVTLSATNFSDLVRILSDLKLLRTEIGKTAMVAAIISDLLAWLHLILIVSIFTAVGNIWAWATTITFGIFCWFIVRPFLSWAISRATKAKKRVTDNHITFILAGVLLCGLITDLSGAHAIVGAFMFGIIMPEGHIIRDLIVEKIHNFISAILMPLFFLSSGLRFNFSHMFIGTSPLLIVGTVIANCATKIISTYLVSLIYGVPPKDGLALGLLMNTKGILAQVIVNVGRDMKVLDNKTFTIMMLSLLVMTCLTKPILYLTHKPTRIPRQNKKRTIEKVKQHGEFRILACVHNLQNALSITNLMRACNPTSNSPLCIFAMHLVELTGRTAASILITNNEYRTRGDQFNNAESGTHIVNAFEHLEEEKSFVRTHTVTAVSPYDTMHDDICSMAEDKCVSFIILPYHRQLTATGTMEKVNDEFANINQIVLTTAPCSVGILVDRGMGALHIASQHGPGDSYVAPKRKQVVMFFLGGADDREALMYAWRMGGYPNIELTVVRFVAGEEASRVQMYQKGTGVDGESELEEELTWQREKEKDSECLYEFTFKTMNLSSVTYIEKVVNDGSEIITVIKDLEDKYDLCIVGRGELGVKSKLLKGLSDWESCQELGIIGDILASSNFSLRSSVLVVQQYCNVLDLNSDSPKLATAPSHIGAGKTIGVDPFMTRKRIYNDDDEANED